MRGGEGCRESSPVDGGYQQLPQGEGTQTQEEGMWGMSRRACRGSSLGRAHQDRAGSPLLMAPLMTPVCDRGQEQAALGPHRPVSTGPVR